MAKHSLNPKNFYYASTLTAAQVTALPEEVDGKNRLASEQTLISNLYLCLGEKKQDELPKRRPHLDLSTTRYSRLLDTIETEFKKERKETYESFQLLARKRQIEESLEQFHSVLSGLAARCNFGTLKTRILRDVFIKNMNNREAQNELCRSTKTPEEVYRSAISYERGYKYVKSYGSATGGATTSGTTGGNGAFQIKTEPVGTIRGGYRNNRQRSLGSFRGRTEMRGGVSRRCYHCDQPKFTPEHLTKCPAKNAKCNFCRKTGHYERTCRELEPTTGGGGGADIEGERQGTSIGGQDQVQTETITIRPSNYETATEYTMAREKEIEANRRKEDTEGNIPQEVEREAEQIPATGEKSVVENNELFLIQAKIRRVHLTKPVQDGRAQNEQQ